MAKKADLFTSEKEEQTTYSFKIPKNFKDRIDAVSGKLESLSQGKKFAINKILLREMEDAITLAESEVEQMLKDLSPNQQRVEVGENNSAEPALPMG